MTFRWNLLVAGLMEEQAARVTKDIVASVKARESIRCKKYPHRSCTAFELIEMKPYGAYELGYKDAIQHVMKYLGGGMRKDPIAIAEEQLEDYLVESLPEWIILTDVEIYTPGPPYELAAYVEFWYGDICYNHALEVFGHNRHDMKQLSKHFVRDITNIIKGEAMPKPRKIIPPKAPIPKPGHMPPVIANPKIKSTTKK